MAGKMIIRAVLPTARGGSPAPHHLACGVPTRMLVFEEFIMIAGRFMMEEFESTTFVGQDKLSNPINFLVGSTGNVMAGKAGCTVTCTKRRTKSISRESKK